MRLSKAWTVASKDFKIFGKKRSILYSILGFEALVSIVLPFIIKYAIGKSANPAQVALLAPLIDAFSVWFVIGAAILPVGIASYSLVGEKVQKSLEPLLATPVTDDEILVGKGIAAFLPAFAAVYLGAAIFMALIDAFTSGALGYLFYPNGTIGVILLLLAPLVGLFSVGINVIISSTSNDVRTAQQLGSLPVAPLMGAYILSEIDVLPLSPTNLLLFAAVLLVVDLFTFYLVGHTFRREEILTRWK